MKKTPILYLIFNAKLNGGNIMIFEQANRLAKRHYQVKIYYVFGPPPSWFPLIVPAQSFFRLIPYIFRSFRGIGIATFWPTAYLLYLIKSDRKVYFIQGLEEEFHAPRLLKWLVRKTFQFPFQRVAISDYLVRNIKRRYHQKAVSMRSHAVDVIGSKKPKSGAIHVLSVVSSYSRVKGIDHLIEVVDKLKKRNLRYYFTLVSSEKKAPPVFDRFIRMADKRTMNKLYMESDILLATPRSEGFFMPGLEAMASGCILISTDSGGVGQYAHHGTNAYIARNYQEIYKKNLPQKILKNTAVRKKFIRNGLKTARQWQWERVMEDIEEKIITSSP